MSFIVTENDDFLVDQNGNFLITEGAFVLHAPPIPAIWIGAEFGQTTQKQLVDQLGDFLVDQLGNFIVTGLSFFTPKPATVWDKGGVSAGDALEAESGVILLTESGDTLQGEGSVSEGEIPVTVWK